MALIQRGSSGPLRKEQNSAPALRGLWVESECQGQDAWGSGPRCWWQALGTLVCSLFCLPFKSSAEAKVTAAAGEINTLDTQEEKLPSPRLSLPLNHACVSVCVSVYVCVCPSEKSEVLH